ncbi:glycosyltransferase family A protein [Cyanobium sp. Cruz-8H5]|nr:glycosyltransferase family 2 protein [Cyanobium sp. Cruz-8H5]MCP9860387.1 glycosyltransferase family 2 protein [Cyanobium sp. Cruz-8H5]
MKVSVLLPTCKRPEMLRTALRSIAAQNALSQVSEIIVIENGEDRRSASVCSEFKLLPINYIFNSIPIPPGRRHALESLRHIKEEKMAILFDDDWWTENHLERGIQSFSFAKDVVASYGACAWIEDEDHHLKQLFGQYNMWFATDEKPIGDRWRFQLQQMLVANLISTTCHFSSLIVNRAAWAECIEGLDDNPFDTDRIIATQLSTKGSVILDRIPSVLIRQHAGQEGVRMNNDIGRMWFDRTSKKLTDIAEANNIDLALAYRHLMHDKAVSVGDLRSFGNFQSIDYLIRQGIIQGPEVKIPGEIRKQTPNANKQRQPVLQRINAKIRGLLRRSRWPTAFR